MEITSDDDDDDFVMLDDTGIHQSGFESGLKQIQPSCIRGMAQEKDKPPAYRVKICEQQHTTDLNIYENQYYKINVFQNDKRIVEDLIRRYSHFDLLFEILFRNKKGFIYPAFPEKGLISFVKTKVSFTKDTNYLEKRMHMLQRFLEKLINEREFNMGSCEEVRKFLSDKQIDIMLKEEKHSSQGYFAQSFNKIKNLIKIGKQNKYKAITEELNQQKSYFENLYNFVKEFIGLLQSEHSQYQNYINKQFNFKKNNEYLEIIKFAKNVQQENLRKLKKLQFNLFCENQDFVMVLKTIQNIEEMKNNEDNYQQVEKAQNIFAQKFNIFQKNKQQQFNKKNQEFTQILKLVQQLDKKV